jgi:Uma2 family endonuclease
MPSIYEWASPENLQPEPITVEIWRNLPEEFCRQIEVINGQAIRCDAPSREHQTATRRITGMLESAAEADMAGRPDARLDVSSGFDVILWELPAATIRRPDAALHTCAPADQRPLPTSAIAVVVEVVSPGTTKTDGVEKLSEYAKAGIPFYWLIWLSGNHVNSIDVHVLDHMSGAYRHVRTLGPEDEVSVIDVPIRIKIDWSRLSNLIR